MSLSGNLDASQRCVVSRVYSLYVSRHNSTQLSVQAAPYAYCDVDFSFATPSLRTFSEVELWAPKRPLVVLRVAFALASAAQVHKHSRCPMFCAELPSTSTRYCCPLLFASFSFFVSFFVSLVLLLGYLFDQRLHLLQDWKRWMQALARAW